jgi:hypothetical protein
MGAHVVKPSHAQWEAYRVTTWLWCHPLGLLAVVFLSAVLFTLVCVAVSMAIGSVAESRAEERAAYQRLQAAEDRFYEALRRRNG